MLSTITKNSWMELALNQAHIALEHNEIPVGAIVVSEKGELIAQGHNLVLSLNDPSAHAEIMVLRQAGQILGRPRLDDCDLYVTLEPCSMCAGAISWAHIRRLYFGAYDPKAGGVEHGPRIFSYTNHQPEIIGGIREKDCAKLLQDFFRSKR